MFLPRLLPLSRSLLLPLSVSLSVPLSVVTASAANPVPKITAASLQARTATLSSDEFEGRAPASAGEGKTVAYLEREFRALGLKPGNPDGTYIQKVPMVGITSKTKSTFTAGGSEVSFTPITEYTASSRRLKPQIEVKDTDIVFVGYGIVAPEYGWDDYKGLDVRGKTVLMLVNDAPVVDPATGKLDPAIFKGNAMTYYGRWSYKYEIASAKGAAACLIIHETGPAGYPFAVLGGGWGTESFDLISPDKNEGRVAIEGWVTHTALERLLTAAGATPYPALKAAAAKRDFKPIPLAAQASFSVTNTTREVTSKNVIAKLDGADPLLRDDYIVYTAHWDHLGRNPKLTGDQIFNGAADNAIGTAVLVEIAQGFASLPAAARPQRSLLFLAVTAEEKGLLGARYYATHPLYPLKKTLANINIDGAQTKGVSRDIEVIGYGNSTLDDLAAAILQKTNRILVPDTEPQKGYFYRSDHFEFAKQGVPAFYTHSGKDIIGPNAGYGKKRSDDYTSEDYHKVSDEIKPWWDFEGAATDARLFFELGREVANTSKWPEWKPGTEFKAKREAMLR
jgi:Zn-dependent M28 family amino/carboxypeptidase